MAIWNHKNISGIKVGNVDHRIALYADDMILFCTNLNKSIPSILSLINTFSTFSGYKIKSLKYYFSIKMNDKILQFLQSPPFLQSEHGFTYLGVKLIPSIENILASNYNSLMTSVTTLLNKWTKLPISLIDRINILKM